MGVVYEAEQTSLKRRVALKVLRFGAVADPEALERFRREAETVAGFHHHGIVPLFAFGCENGVHFYAMQFIDGHSLGTILEQARGQGRALEAKEVARWGLQAAKALAHAHQRGVVHRDVKPGNLLLDSEGTVWLTDFGLARRAEETTLTLSGVLMGTPRYMSPEQAAAVKQPIDHRTDVYSLGATLYELATSRPVCDAETPQAVLNQILTAEPLPPSQLRRDLPRDLETILLTCLAKEPARRYATSRALAEDLRAFLDDRAIKARRPSLVERGRRWVREQKLSVPSVAGAAALLLLLFGVLVAGLLSFQGSAFEPKHTLELKVVDYSAGQGIPWTGEVFNAGREESLAAPFAVPTVAPVHLPAGDHLLRLTRPGYLSATYPFSVRDNNSDPRLTVLYLEPQTMQLVGPGAAPTPPRRYWPAVNDRDTLVFRSQHLWAKPLEKVASFVVFPGANGTDLVTLTTDKDFASWCQRLDGKSGEPRWRQDLAGDTPLGHFWQTHRVGFSCRLLQPAPDLDGDGTPDLVWAGIHTPVVVALSGKTGELLWHDAPAEFEARLAASPRLPVPYLDGVTATVALPDVDGDGIPDLTGVFVLQARESDPRRRFLRALSGRTGKLLWSVELPTFPVEERGLRREDLFTPALIDLEGRPVLACVAGETLLGIDVATGQPAWPARALGLDLLRPPQFVDLRGDGGTQALLLHREAEGPLHLSALNLPGGETLWERTWAEAPTASEDWPLVTDLDGDGKPEVIVRQSRFRYSEGREYETVPLPREHDPNVTVQLQPSRPTYRVPQEGHVGVAVLEGSTGETRWEHWLGRDDFNQFSSREPLRLLVGPDPAADGTRALFVASLLRDRSSDNRLHEFLYVDALAGADGRSLWWWRQRVGGRFGLAGPYDGPGRPVWWPASKSKRPLLVVPFRDTDNRAATYVLSPTGRLLHVVSRLWEPVTGDLDGDGAAELLGLVGDQFLGSPGMLNPLRAGSPADVVRSEQNRPLAAGEGSSPKFVGEEPEPEETARTIGPDPRLAVALPWDRYPFHVAGQPDARGYFFLRLGLLGVIVAPLVVVIVVLQKRWLRRRFTEEEIRRRSRRQTVLVVLILAVSAFLVLLAGIVWLWADAAELMPGEYYRWRWWYVPWLCATAFLFQPLLLLAVVGIVVARWARNGWRPRRPAAASSPPVAM
jgi:tRNA A-37 threonylcarbamoyl transferase component Bud32/outer membrane protein assembly factor BamB